MMRTLASLIALATLAGCASPDPKLYTLMATNPPVASAQPPGPPLVLELHRVNIPGYADRPEIVRSAADYRVHLAKNERWSEPLGDLVQRVLTDDLARRLPGATVFSDAGAISADPTRIVSVDIGRIESDGAGEVVLEAQFAVHDADDKAAPLTRSVRLTAPTQGSATDDYAAALSTVCGQLADAIVTQGGLAAEPAQAHL